MTDPKIVIMNPKWHNNTDFPYPYICTLSPILRLAMQCSPSSMEKIQNWVQETILGLEENEVVKTSLQSPTPKGVHLVRQIDLRASPGGPIILKVFASIREKIGWYIQVEGADEDHWEQENMHPEAN